MAPHGQQCRGGNVTGIRAQSNGLDHVGSGAYAASGDQGYAAAYALVPQPLVHRCQRQLNGNTHIVPYSGGRRAGAAPKAVDGDDIRTAAGDAAGDGGDVVYRRHLDDDRLFVRRGFL